MSTNVTSKGQVTIPKKIREFLGIEAGSPVDFDLSPSGEVILRPVKGARRRPSRAFARLRGRATVKMRTEEILALTRGDDA